MASPEAFKIGLGTEYIGKTRVSVVPKHEQKRGPRPASSVATHETEHAVTAIVNGTPVESVTIIPGPGYNGLIKLARPDPIAAVAPHANGRDGTSHDVFITKLGGHNVEALSRIAKKITNEKRKHIEEVASFLDEKGTLGGNDIKRVMEKVDREESEPKLKKADVFISDTNGGQRKIENVEVKGGKVTVPIDLVPGKWTPMPGKPKIAG